MALENLLGDLALDATLQKRYGGGKTPWSRLITAAGDLTVVTPAAGKLIELLWASVVPSPDNVSANLVTIYFEDDDPVTEAKYVVYAVGHWEPLPGPVDKALIVRTENSQPVTVALHFIERD